MGVHLPEVYLVGVLGVLMVVVGLVLVGVLMVVVGVSVGVLLGVLVGAPGLLIQDAPA